MTAPVAEGSCDAAVAMASKNAEKISERLTAWFKTVMTMRDGSMLGSFDGLTHFKGLVD